jgi:hypothetical protein
MALSNAAKGRAYRERQARKIDELLGVVAELDNLKARVTELESVVYWDEDTNTGENIPELELTDETKPPEDWARGAVKDHQAADDMQTANGKTTLEDEDKDEPDDELSDSSPVSIIDIPVNSSERRERAIAMIHLAEMDELERIKRLSGSRLLREQYADYLAVVTCPGGSS